MTARSKIEVLVVPADTWNHPGLDSGFKLLRVPDAGLMLYQETRVGAELSSSNR
nr:Scr1 family TA system antitoxin-like transcriptional regulator [Haloactinospora alba]